MLSLDARLTSGIQRACRCLSGALACASAVGCSDAATNGPEGWTGPSNEASVDAAVEAGESGAVMRTDSGAGTPPTMDAGSRDSSPVEAASGSADSGPVDDTGTATDAVAAESAAPDGSSGTGLDLGIFPDYDNAKSNTGGLAGFVSRTGVVPLAASNYMNITNGSFDKAGAQGFIDEVLASGVKIASISLATGDSDVPSGTQSQIAAAVTYGKQKGVTVWIRFGYEMNGNWSPSYHGGDPTIFKTTWAEVATAVRGVGGVMVWAPNIVAGGISPYASVLPDDMSTIDIVGLDFYHFNSSSTDLSIDPSEVDNAIGSIYSLVQQVGKPFIMTETGVSYFDDSGTWATATDAEVAEKQTWLGLLTSSALVAKYPQYGGFFWFDYNKYESSQYRDFSISQQSLEAMMFSSWVAQNRSSLNLGQ